MEPTAQQHPQHARLRPFLKSTGPSSRCRTWKNVKSSLRRRLLGHFGAEAIVQAIAEEGKQWPNIKADAVEFVRKCIPCQRFKISRHGFHPVNPIHAELPFDHIAIDLAGPFPTSALGNHYLLVLADVCTRFVLLRAIPDKRARTVAGVLVQIFHDFGFPRIIQSDNGTEFCNSVVKEVCAAVNIDHRLISPYHPRANGLAERTVQTATGIIKKQLLGAKSEWDKYVPGAQLAMNNKVAALHGSTPFSLMFGRRLNTFSDHSNTESLPLDPADLEKRCAYLRDIVFPAVAERSQDTRDKAKARAGRAFRSDDPFPEGSFVMCLDPTRASKLDPMYHGPFKVLRRNRGGAYVLQDPSGALLPRNQPPSHLKLISRDPIVAGQSYEVEAILDHRGAGHTREYLVKWRGFGPDHNTWEGPHQFDDLGAIQEYWKRRGRDVQTGEGVV